MLVSRHVVGGCLAVAVGVLLAGCGTPLHKAPVEDKGTATGAISSTPVYPPAAGPAPMTVSTLPGAENAGRPGYYTVKAGDTLIRIGLENGQSWKDLARWNNLENPNLIEVGQVLRVSQHAVGALSPSSMPVTTVTLPAETGVVTRPVGSVSVTPVTPVGSSASSSSSSSGSTASTPATAAEDGLGFIWPAAGSLLAGFDEARNKGYDISGKAGDAVLAAADGRVVYAGSGLRGYGNLIILKHNNTYLTAYAHNQTLLVKEDQSVRKGQKIAEMGSTDADRVKLHFEIRRQGKPVDPSRYLPAR